MYLPLRAALLVAVTLSLVACPGASKEEQAAAEKCSNMLLALHQQGKIPFQGGIVQVEKLDNGVLTTHFDACLQRFGEDHGISGDAVFWVKGDTVYAVNLMAQRISPDSPVAPAAVIKAAKENPPQLDPSLRVQRGESL